MLDAEGSSHANVDLPEDLTSFLGGGRPRVLDAGAYGTFLLVARGELKVETLEVSPSNSPFAEENPFYYFAGSYPVPAVNLVREPAWWFLWLPNERRYGTFDEDHGDLAMFAPDLTWTQITNDPKRFAEAAEVPCEADVPMEYLRPWARYPYVADGSLGGNGPAAWEADLAIHWYEDLFAATGLEGYVEAGLNLDPLEFPRQVRAAAYVLAALGRRYLWPFDSLGRLLNLAVAKLEAIASVVTFDEPSGSDHSIATEIAILRSLLRAFTYPYVEEESLARWGAAAWEVDPAIDWYQDLFAATGLEGHVEAGLNLDPMRYPQQIRAAAYMLVALARDGVWPPHSLGRLLKLAVAKLKAIASVVTFDQPSGSDHSIPSEIAILRSRLRFLTDDS